ncbi:DUF4375 domain-containing protein [Luteolibacter flavescens]|uniref:DUF4375 domain-containing protein n=1 Tax=Luteolibacter flavescens TaxID=1859460 RepID=A0ABT3FUV6_9BACT|nr:DUF4375 domain-containing protein [Luteolibacter flavescens]MCW1887371.1 DUF4375 domain-containing protein [Luteolibacter flavescens]
MDYSEVRAYLYNPPHKLGNDIIQDGKLHPDVVDPQGIKLDAKQVEQLLKASYTREPDRRGSGCFLPHHGIVFYDHDGKAVAHLSICFLCNRAASAPYEASLQWDITALSQFITSLGLPVFKEFDESDAHFIALARKWPDAKVKEKLDEYLFSTENGNPLLGDYERLLLLQGLGDRIHALLLAYLSDKALRAEMLKASPSDASSDTLFSRICDAFGDSPPSSVIPLLAPFFEESDPSVRCDATETIAKTGAPASVAYIRKAFADPGDDLAISALGGLQVAIDRSAVHPDTRKQLFPDVQAFQKSGWDEEWAKALAGLNPHEASEYFLTPEIFNPDSPRLDTILRVLCEANLQLPRERLLALIEELKATKLTREKQQIAEPALLLLGRQRNPGDLDLLRGMGNDTLARCAMPGLLAWHGLEGYRDRLSKLEVEKDFAALNEHQRLHIAVYEFENAGPDIGAYFSGHKGDRWRDALAGLKQMKRGELAAILEEAVAKFGDEGPSNDREIRSKQVDDIEEKSGFKDLDARLREAEDTWNLSLDRFAIEHADSFK